MQNYNEKMKELRETRQITQATIAEVLQITKQQYHLYESGKRELPIKHLIVLCKYYGVSADYILGLEKVIGNKWKNSQFTEFT